MIDSPETPLRLVRARRLDFAAATAAARPTRDPEELRYYRDIADRYGVALREERLADARAACYPEMGSQLLASLGALTTPIDLIVVGNTVPDLDIGRFVGCTLSEETAGAAMFAITDAGLATPFLALRAAAEYARGGSVRQLLVLLLDQATLPYDTELLDCHRPTADCGVALLFDTEADAESCGSVVRQLPNVGADDVRGGLLELLAPLAAPAAARMSVIAGCGLDATTVAEIVGPTVPVTATPPGRPASGAWWTCFDVLERQELSTAFAHHAVVADYDPALRSLSVASIPVTSL